MFWSAQHERSLGHLLGAHEGLVLSLDWHPLGHSLASGSLDTTVKFWIRQRPADSGLDPYILGQRAAEAMGIKAAEPVISVAEDEGFGEEGSIPGMRPRRGGGRDSRGDFRGDSRGDFRDYNRDSRGGGGFPPDYRNFSRDNPRDNFNSHGAPRDQRDNNRPPPPPPPPSRF